MLLSVSTVCKEDVLQHCKVGNKPVYVIRNGTHKVHTPELSTSYHQYSLFYLEWAMSAGKKLSCVTATLENEEIN
jgi:hypothetical protein